MNLHIVPDNSFINTFYDNLLDLGLLEENRIMVRTNRTSLVAIKRQIPFASLYTDSFDRFIGDTRQYKKVFIHYFTPLLYRWVAKHEFNELNWVIWGGDLYNLSELDEICYEPETMNRFVGKGLSLNELLFEAKVTLLHKRYKQRAYAKIANVLTWMEEEYVFAVRRLALDAKWSFFFYENPFPYEKLDRFAESNLERPGLLLMIGNSASPTNNHLDIVRFLESHKVQASLVVPVSYGDTKYASFLKRNLSYRYGDLEFVDHYMPFEEYLRFISRMDALVMNTIRPQGYGNILMMLYLGRPVYFNEKNISLPDLTRNGIKWRSTVELSLLSKTNAVEDNKVAVTQLLSHDRLLHCYRLLFG